MPTAAQQTASEVALAARILARDRLVEAFGHVSARCEGGFLITSTSPLGEATGETIHMLDPSARPEPDAVGVPLEAPMHAAVYAARQDVGAICRTHSPAAVSFATRATTPPLLHGLGGLAGEVGLCERTDLVTDAEAASEVAGALGGADCLLLRANGSLATAPDISRAVVRAHYLEERCRVGAEAGPEAIEMTAAELALRSRHHEAEAERAWAWLCRRYGDGAGRDFEEDGS